MEKLLRIFLGKSLPIILFISLLSCERRGNVEYKKVKRGDQLSFGKFTNGLEDSTFIFMDTNGNVTSYEVYSEGKALMQVFYFINGDTMGYADDKIFKAFYANKKIETIQQAQLKNNEPIGIYFDSTGHITKLNSELTFLTKSDSLRLKRDYPDWETQVREWKYGKTTP